ncbi:enoyl-ACP reductase FabV [Pelosinus sp. sgz500959]|uniref:enoyl-ACP reductase FabV n=1 Tax=Pelosinus sp. sgz500959 TaxID=3242472 RepID=UPI0036732454
MIIKPKFKGFICTTAHPEGCARSVKEQIDYVKQQSPVKGPKNVLVIGASTGYGLASRIVSTFSSGANTIGVFFEKPAAGNKTATAGWYNTVAFEQVAKEENYYAKSINGDAFSTETKEEVIELIKKDLGQVDLVIYSLAAPRRVHPVTGETLVSSIKPVGKSFTSKNLDFHSEKVAEITLEPASDEEVRQAVGVMGGEDWEMWIEALRNAGVLATGATTISYSYIGPELTYPIYREGTIGKAKGSLEAAAQKIHSELSSQGGKAFVSVNKALVTQASTAIPAMSLYMSLLFKVMKEKGIHENCVEQIYRLFIEQLYSTHMTLDEKGRIRLDDWEMKEEVQREVLALWQDVSTENVGALSDVAGYRNDFFRLFGFGFDDVEYDQDVDIQLAIPSIND